MKLTFEDKIQIYNEWKFDKKSFNQIVTELCLATTNVKYFMKLADHYGINIL